MAGIGDSRFVGSHRAYCLCGENVSTEEKNRRNAEFIPTKVILVWDMLCDNKSTTIIGSIIQNKVSHLQPDHYHI